MGFYFWDEILALIWPPDRCLLCNSQIPAVEILQNRAFCRVCRQDLSEYICCENCGAFYKSETSVLHQQICHKSTVGDLAGVTAVAPYAGEMREKILRLKYHGRRWLARPLGWELAEAWRKTGWTADVILPVPLHTDRLKQRGYNQCDLLALACGNVLELPVLNDVLQRVRSTPVQHNLTVAERQSNVAGAFACAEKAAEQLVGRKIILIDDIITSGATFRACAEALKPFKPAAVYGLAVAGKLLTEKEPTEN